MKKLSKLKVSGLTCLLLAMFVIATMFIPAVDAYVYKKEGKKI